MEPWYKQLGFQENPLDARPNSGLVGMNEQEGALKTFILKEQLCFLHGLTGSGKTSLLKRVQESMPDHTFIYLDADAVPADFDLIAAIKGKRNFLDKLRLREMPAKKPVLIIDEFQATDNRLVLEARSRWENPTERQIKSIVIAQISEQLKNVPGSFKDRLGNRLIHLSALDNTTMKNILKQRLGAGKQNYFDQLSETTVDFLVHVADGNARRLLEFTEMLFEYHWEKFTDRNPLLHKQEYKIQFPAAKQILRAHNIAIEGYGKNEEKEAQNEEVSEITQIKEEVPEHAEIKQPESVDEQRVDKTFDKGFTIAEQNVLRALMRHDRMSLKQVATNIHLEINKCNGLLANLKKKGAIHATGKIQGEKGWQITESAKRTMVTK